ncbi:MAG: tetratricopeptide repeat protein, partial [Polyangiaceae bacterium]|nr:tetratricopeptide repeat protein [Polyangiaceae bacterium]
MATEEPYSVELWVTPRAGPGSRVFDLELYDHQRKGWAAAGVARLDFFEDPETASFLNAFLRGDSVRVRDGLSFGRELGARLFAREELGQGFRVVEQRRGGRPIRMELVLPVNLGDDPSAPRPRVALDDIPFELLADDTGFWFRRPGWSLVRTFKDLPAVAYRLPKKGRALLAWANPLVPHEDGTNQKLDAKIFEAHEAAFERGVKEMGLEPRAPLRRATQEGLGEGLRERPETPLLALVAHGDARGGAVLLHASEGSDEGTGVLARDLAAMCRAGHVKVAVLWMCHGAKRNEQRSSVAAALLDPEIGDAAAVVASHAALRANRTTRFAGRLFRSLRDGVLERAVAEARHALAEDDLQWAAPVYYARPYAGRSVSLEESFEILLSESVRKRDPAERIVEGAPQARLWFRGRGDDIARSLGHLRAGRWVTFTGMPGIGKTALAVEVSRRAIEDASFGLARALWIDLATKANAVALRDSLAVLFGLDPARCPDDLALAKGIGDVRALLVLDNAEDLQRSDGDKLRALLDTLLRYAPGLRALVTSRRALGHLDGIEERVFPVGRLPKGVDREVFVAVAGERLAEERADSAAVDKLVAALEGHPQSIVLVAGQVGRGVPLRELRARVEAEDPEVVREADLFDDEVGEDRDAPLRTRRLVSSLNLSFRPLVKAAPGAAEMFAWLGMFPAGLPEALVTAVFGDEANRHVVRLMALNMIERRGPDDRLGLPGPVRWYARKQQGAVMEGRAVMEPGRREELLERSASAMAGWLRALRAKLGKPGAAAACSSAAEDGANLVAFALDAGATSRSEVICNGMASAFAAYARLADYGDFSREAVAVGECLLSLMGQRGSPRPIAVVSEALGDLFLRTARLNDAERAYEQALPIYRAIDNRLGEANTRKALGDLFLRTARLNDAERAYELALPIYRAIDARLGEANTLRALGDLFLRTARLNDAERAYELALPIYRAIDERLGEANTLQALGDLFLRTARLNDAERAYELALPIYRA